MISKLLRSWIQLIILAALLIAIVTFFIDFWNKWGSFPRCANALADWGTDPRFFRDIPSFYGK